MTPVRLGVAGLGRAFTVLMPTLAAHPGIELTAAADARPEARAQFMRAVGGTPYRDVERLCADPAVEAVYVTTPIAFRLEHVRLAAAAGKHVLVETPMALTLDDCQAMVGAAQAAGVSLVVGPSQGAGGPCLRARALIQEGALGAVRMITALDFTDALYRPHRPEELVTAAGGGVVFRQAVHQVDIVRLLGGGRVRSLRAATGRWDPARPTEGAYAAWLEFEGGAFATLTYSGYGRFDSGELLGGAARQDYGSARAQLLGLPPGAEAALAESGGFGTGAKPAALRHNDFGFVLVSCERGDLRPGPEGVMVYGDDAKYLDPLPPTTVPHGGVIDELVAAIRQGTPPLHSGQWGVATMEVCLGILRSAAEDGEMMMERQVAV